MARRDYLDFDLLVEPEGDGQYAARVTGSPAGEASNLFQVPFNDLEIENYLLRFSRTRATVRRINSPELDAARRFGSALFGAVFAGDVGATYLLSRQTAESKGMGLRIRLRLTEAPKLVDLPWELLFDSGMKGDFVALSDHTPVVRYPQMPSPVKPLAVTPPLRILMVVSSPNDYVQLDVGGEERLLREALADLIAEGLVEVTLLEPASLSALHRMLDRSEVHVLHYIGHGGYDAATQEGVLIMEGAEGRGRKVEAGRLGTILNDHDPLRLVVLNACEGARSGTEDPFSGVASELARRGAPAVIAMQFEITDEAAKAFSHAFYVSVANGYPVDAAVSSARKAMFAAGDNIEWATPVLYLRSTDGVVFDLKAGRPVPVPEPPLPLVPSPVPPQPPVAKPPQPTKVDISRDYERALEAVEAKTWTEALRLLHIVLRQDPNHADAKSLVEVAQERVRAGMLIDEGRTAHAAGRWEDAVAAFTEVAELDPDFSDEDGLRADAELRLTELRQPVQAPVQVEPTPMPPAAPRIPSPAQQVPRPAARKRFRAGWVIAAIVGVALIPLYLVGALISLVPPDDPITSTTTTTIGRTSGTPGATVTGEELPSADVVAVQMAAPPTIDAEGSEWRFDWQAESLSVVAPVGFLDVAPSAGWWIAWDDQALYVFVDAIDPTGVSQFWYDQPDQLWKGDAAHFEFGADPRDLASSAGLRPNDVHVLLGPALGAEPMVALAGINRMENGTFVSGPAEGAIEVVSFLTAKPGYLLEARIPWQLINVSDPAIGSVFAMNMNISDGDGSRGLRVMVSSNPDRSPANQVRPGTWNTLVLGQQN